MATALDQIRLLIADTATPQLLTDDQIQSMLDLWTGSEDPTRVDIFRAAADSLDTIAVSEVLVAKKIRTQDLSTDGPAVAAALQKRAADLRKRADDEEAADAGIFEIYDSRGAGRLEAEESRYGSTW